MKRRVVHDPIEIDTMHTTASQISHEMRQDRQNIAHNEVTDCDKYVIMTKNQKIFHHTS